MYFEHFGHTSWNVINNTKYFEFCLLETCKVDAKRLTKVAKYHELCNWECFNWPRSSWVKARKNLHKSPLSQSFYDYQNQKFFHLKHSWTQSLDIAVLVSWKSLLARSKPWNTFRKERENITYVCKIRKRKQSSKETWAWDEKNAVKCQRFWSISKLCSKFPCSCISFLVE